MAKHKLLKATILCRPRDRAMSVFAAHSAIRKRRMPALHIETAVRDITKNAASIGRVHGDVRRNFRVLYRGPFPRVDMASNCTTKSRWG